MLVAAPYAGGGGKSPPGCDEAGRDEYVKPAEPSGGGGGGQAGGSVKKNNLKKKAKKAQVYSLDQIETSLLTLQLYI